MARRFLTVKVDKVDKRPVKRKRVAARKLTHAAHGPVPDVAQHQPPAFAAPDALEAPLASPEPASLAAAADAAPAQPPAPAAVQAPEPPLEKVLDGEAPPGSPEAVKGLGEPPPTPEPELPATPEPAIAAPPGAAAAPPVLPAEVVTTEGPSPVPEAPPLDLDKYEFAADIWRTVDFFWCSKADDWGLSKEKAELKPKELDHLARRTVPLIKQNANPWVALGIAVAGVYGPRVLTAREHMARLEAANATSTEAGATNG